MSSSFPRTAVPRAWFLSAAAILLVVFALELYLSARLESQTFDEPAHMYAGYSYWLRSDFGINPEHPPLVKLVATLPLLLSKPKYPAPLQIHFRAQSGYGGMQMMSEPGADGMLSEVRVAVSIFVFALALLVFLAAREMFGDVAALLALLLFVFDPLILAHGPLLGTDMGATCCIFAAIYTFYRYVKRPTLAHLGLCCLATGLAFAAKHSAILVFPMIFLLAAIDLFMTPMDADLSAAAPTTKHRVLRMAGAYAVIVVSSIVMLWAFYGFRYAARPGGQQIVPPTAVYLQDLHHPVEANLIAFAERHHLLPESYLYGLTDVTILSREGRVMFLLGKRYPEGKWFYFPAAFVIKMTIGFLILLALVPFARALWKSDCRREVVFLILPVLLFFGFAMTAKLDIGIRHILPIMPFLIVLVAGAAAALLKQARKWAWVVALLLLFDVASSLHAFPNYLPYSNEAFGGPSRTYLVLEDSNVGWGGGLKALHADLAARGITDCWFAYSDLPDPANFHIPCRRLPTYFSFVGDQGQQQPVPAHIDGPVFMSSEERTGYFWGPGDMNPYQQFVSLQPSHVIAGEILEYEGSFDIPKVAAISNYVYAIGLLRQRKVAQAVAPAEQAIALDPDSLNAHEILSSVYAANGRNDDAELEYHVALQLYQQVPADYKTLAFPPSDPLAKN
ncbi:MAG TPA: glycosyltransferase family 39 protein [Terracidiphilus sp.]|nr:glycosyltransferase family 39 protein [Terracidiphilus sp.]